METPSTAPKRIIKPQTKDKKKDNKRARIIIRNLSFKATEEAVTNWFAKYGDIQDVKLLRKPSGDLIGCAFVQYSQVPCAARAIKECNAKPFLGRPIAIDWAIPKQQYMSGTSSKDDEVTQQSSSEAPQEEDEDGIDKDGDSEEGSDDESVNDSDEASDDEGASNESEGSDDENVKKHVKNTKGSKWSGCDTSKEHKSDVDEGKTVFIRNLDFSSSQESLKTCVAAFGDVHYALLCMDKVMERPKGTAFVKFKDGESALKLIEASKNSSLVLDGRILNAVFAVSHNDLETERQNKTKEKKDNRNLYLAREGMIRPGTQAAQGVSAADMAKRQKNEFWKKQMLRNLHMFISRERLCIHNIPLKMTDKQFKKLIAKNSPNSKITEARIMRDMKKVEGKIHPSKGYGFVTFTKHEDALTCLRNMNNNPSIFTADKRPIVEFSVENRAALKAKEQRTLKSKEKGSAVEVGVTDKSVKATVVEIENGRPAPEFSGTKADRKITGLPSHSGPKIRHVKREKQQGEGTVAVRKPKITRKMFKNPEKRKLSTQKKSTQEKDVPFKKRKVATKKGKNGSSRFDAMVQEYQKGFAAESSGQKKKKWFDS